MNKAKTLNEIKLDEHIVIPADTEVEVMDQNVFVEPDGIKIAEIRYHGRSYLISNKNII